MAHKSERTAERCIGRDHRDCQSQRGYSDRRVRVIATMSDAIRYSRHRGPGKPVEDAAELDYTADRVHDVWTVRGPGGERWWPSEEAMADIARADDAATRVLQICEREPSRGEWRS